MQIIYQINDLQINPSNFWVVFTISLWSIALQKCLIIITCFFTCLVTGWITLVTSSFTPQGDSGLGMPTVVLEWQWSLEELALFP